MRHLMAQLYAVGRILSINVGVLFFLLVLSATSLEIALRKTTWLDQLSSSAPFYFPPVPLPRPTSA